MTYRSIPLARPCMYGVAFRKLTEANLRSARAAQGGLIQHRPFPKLRSACSCTLPASAAGMAVSSWEEAVLKLESLFEDEEEGKAIKSILLRLETERVLRYFQDQDGFVKQYLRDLLYSGAFFAAQVARCFTVTLNCTGGFKACALSNCRLLSCCQCHVPLAEHKLLVNQQALCKNHQSNCCSWLRKARKAIASANATSFLLCQLSPFLSLGSTLRSCHDLSPALMQS